jgi:hypothetical protein
MAALVAGAFGACTQHTGSSCQHPCDLAQTLYVEIDGPTPATSVTVSGDCGGNPGCSGGPCRMTTFHLTGDLAGSPGLPDKVCTVTAVSQFGEVVQKSVSASYMGDSCCAGEQFGSPSVVIVFSGTDGATDAGAPDADAGAGDAAAPDAADATEAADAAAPDAGSDGAPADALPATDLFGGPLCLEDGWCWERPLPFGAYLIAAWGSGAGDVWSVGNAGVAIHFDGKTWKLWPRATTADLYGLWGAAPSDVWATGIKGTIIHFDGASWTPVASPPAVATLGIYGVWGAAADDVWAVGDQQTILHYDGKAWTVASGAAGGSPLRAVWGAAADDVWAVGDGYEGVAMHWDGKAWSYEAPPFPEHSVIVGGVWGAAGDDVWVSDYGGATTHWDGKSWLPYMGAPPICGLTSLVGTATDDVWLFGLCGASHYDGKAWTAVAALDSDSYNAGWLDGSGGGWAFGVSGRIARKSGADWTFVSGVKGENSFNLAGVWATDGEAWAVGQPRMIHFDGQAWTRVEAATTMYAQEWTSVWSAAPNDAWAVAWGTVPEEIQHWDGTAWTVYPHTESLGAMTDVWGSGASDVWMSGAGSKLLHFDGKALTQWTGAQIGVGGDFASVHGTAADDVWLAGSAGVLAHWDGKAWSKVDAGTTADLGRVYPFARDDVWISGTGVLRRWDGRMFTDVPPPRAGLQVYDIAGSSSGDVWAVAGNGELHHWDGAAWHASAVPGVGLSRLARTPSGELVVAGNNGAILRHR